MTSIGPPLAKMSHFPRSFSSLKKSKRCCLVTGNQTEVEALSTTPEGSPGSSMLTRLITQTSAPNPPTCSFSQRHAEEAHSPEQKLLLMRLISFKMLLLPSCVTAPTVPQIYRVEYTRLTFIIMRLGIWVRKGQKKRTCSILRKNSRRHEYGSTITFPL